MKLLISRSVSQVHSLVMKGEELTASDQSERDRLGLGKLKEDQTDKKKQMITLKHRDSWVRVGVRVLLDPKASWAPAAPRLIGP